MSLSSHESKYSPCRFLQGPVAAGAAPRLRGAHVGPVRPGVHEQGQQRQDAGLHHLTAVWRRGGPAGGPGQEGERPAAGGTFSVLRAQETLQYTVS